MQLKVSKMELQRYRRKIRTMLVMVLLAILYTVLLIILHTLTGDKLADGAIGVILGLYICSHPAANAVDLIFMERGSLQRISAEWSGVQWLTLNLVTMIAGWIVIVIGAGRFYYG
jgi:hypothetical protein